MNENMTLSQAISKKYELLAEIGEKCYEKYRNGQITVSEEEEAEMKEIRGMDIFIGQQTGNYEKKIMQCPQCQEPLVENAVFCSKCGCSIEEYRKQNTKHCDVCAAIISNQNYCDVCGAKVVK